VKFLGSARALVLAVAVVTEVAGLGLAVLPALAAPSPPGDPVMTFTGGGDRTSDNAVAGTAGVQFREIHATPSTCTTQADGTCTLSPAFGGTHHPSQVGAPAGWFLSPQLGISPNSFTSDVTARDYSSVTAEVPLSGTDVPSSTSGSTTNPTARSGVWAVSRDNPAVPGNCGLNVALLFDLSFSVDGNLRDLQNAGVGFVNSLQGTPSSVALYTMGTHAPVNSTNNSNFPLTPLTTTANVDAVNSKIRGYTIMNNPAQYTNWDEGMWQIANAEGPPGGTRPHYDAVIVLSDGDPTVYGPTGIGQTAVITRFIDVENGIFSANALKAKGTKVIAVGINATHATTLNLRAISGPAELRDFFTTNWVELETALRALALANCGGTVNVTKLVVPASAHHDLAAAVPAPGWTMHATGPTVTPATATTNQTGAVSFATTGASEPVTVTEDVKSGFRHFLVDGKNAACTNSAGRPVPVTDAATGPGFTVTAHALGIIKCKVYNEQLASSLVTTRLSAIGGEIPVGGSASDSATLHDVTSTGGGTVQYRFYDSLSACDGDVAAFAGPPPPGGTLVSTVTVTGGTVPASAAHTFGAAGTFYWAAFYSGDPSHLPAASNCATEPLEVTRTQPRVTTRLTAASGQIPVGGTTSDTATLVGAFGTASGTVEYRYYPSLATCDSDVAAFPGTPPPGGTLVSTVTVTGGVVPASAAHTFGAAGTFYWAAFYSGGPNNLPAASDCATEPLVVTLSPSRITTELSIASREIGVGGAASDSATLGGVTGTAGGTVEYRHYPSLSDCDAATLAFPPAAGGTLVSTVTVTGGVVPPSALATFPVAGTFYWAAFYSGDPSNAAAASDCATEPLVVNPAPSRVSTQLSAAGGQIGAGGTASDSATLADVTGTAAGTVEYRYYSSLTDCQTATSAFPPAAGGTLVSTVTVTGGLVPPSAAATFPVGGTFYWAAFYSGDADDQAAASDCATEPLVVTPAPSRITTQLSATGLQIPVGGSADDSAVLHETTATAGGTVEYRLYDSLVACEAATLPFPSQPASGGTLVSTVTVTNGSVPGSAAVTFPVAGLFYWAAFYSGDPSNLAVASHCATEPLVVNPAPSLVTTQLSPAGEIGVDGTASDSATLTGVTSTAGGTLEYRYYGTRAACDTDVAAFPGTPPPGGTLVSSVTVTSGVVPPSAAHTFAAAGTFYWAAFYSGDHNNRPAANDCATEALVVTPAASQVTTVLSAVATGREIPVGGSASDTATLSGATGTAGGTLEYRFYGSLAACDADVTAFPGTPPPGGTLVSTVTVTNGVMPASATHTFGAAGTFYWAAFYSGDPNNMAAASTCASEPLVVTAAPSEVTTQLSAAAGEIPVGGSASDTATLNGVTGTAGGTMEYRYYGTLTACDSDVAAFAGTPPAGGTLASTVTVTGGTVPPSAAHTFGAAGTFYWAAFYSGDPNNLAAASVCATEPLVVTPAQARITTVLSPADVQIAGGGSASDSATLGGVTGTAGGTVEYRYYDSLTACQTATSAFPPVTGGTLASTETVTDGVVPRSAAITFTVVGTYYWAAFYSGDPNNLAAASDCATEALVVTPAATQVETALSATGGEIAVGGAAADTTRLVGASATAGGTVEYRYYPSLAACDSDVAAFPGTPPPGGTPVSTVTVTDRLVPSSASATFGAAGTFYWAAFYSGDPNNLAAASTCATEPLVVTAAVSGVTTRLSAAAGEIAAGGSASDTATLAGVTNTAAGTVEYRYYPSLAACDSDVAAFPGTPPPGGTPVSTVTVTGGTVPASAPATFPVAGTFYWAAFYSGDPNHLPAASTCAAEPLVVTPAAARVTTRLTAASGEIPVDGSASDTATLTGAFGTASGTVEYRYYDSLTACQTATSAFPPATGGTLVSTVTVTGGTVPPSAAATFPVADTFYWAAYYSGDPSNAAAVSDCATEPLVVTAAPSQVTTQLSSTNREIGVGGTASDTATLTRVTGTAGGTVEYRFYDSLSACQTAAAASPPAGGTLVSTETVTGGAVLPSATHTFDAAGTFYWAAFYSGDPSNAAAVSDCATEPLAVTPAPSQVTTELSANGAEIMAGGSASDTATLHGVTSTAGGTVEYRFYTSPSFCDRDAAQFPGTAPSRGNLVSTETVTNGAAPPSAAFTFPASGTYYWAAFYSGDPSNRADASDCATEPLVVALGPPASVIVHMDWVIDGVLQHVPSQDPDFQASLALSSVAPIPASSPAGVGLVTAPGSSGEATSLDPSTTWGEEEFGFAVGEDIHIAVTDETVPPGCSHTVGGHLEVQTIDQSKDEFLVTATATCDQAPTVPGEEGTHLTPVKRISNLLGNPAHVPLTSWTLTARPESGGPVVISGTTGVTGNVEPGVPYVLAESAVPGYKQLPDPALLELVPGASGSWRCVETGPEGQSGLQDFDGGTGDVIVQPGRHVTCTALNRRTLAIPVGPAQTGGGLAAAARSGPALAAGLALMAAGALLGLGGLRLRRKPRSAPRA